MSQEGAQVENGAVEAAPVLRITVSDVLGLLAQGKSRKEIAEHYGRTQSDMNKMVWGHPKLKNRKAKKQYTGIELEDDTDETVAETATNIVAEVADGPGPEHNHAFENQEEMKTDAQEVVAAEPATTDWN
jgi:hypothetical protein